MENRTISHRQLLITGSGIRIDPTAYTGHDRSAYASQIRHCGIPHWKSGNIR